MVKIKPWNFVTLFTYGFADDPAKNLQKH